MSQIRVFGGIHLARGLLALCASTVFTFFSPVYHSVKVALYTEGGVGDKLQLKAAAEICGASQDVAPHELTSRCGCCLRGKFVREHALLITPNRTGACFWTAGVANLGSMFLDDVILALSFKLHGISPCRASLCLARLTEHS